MNKNVQDRINKNNAYYARFASKAAERTENRNFDKAFEIFLDGLDSSGLILDIGSGAGIHLKEFLDRGFKALGVEPSSEMRTIAKKLGVTSIEGTFESIDQIKLNKVSGIWCASSLLHVPREELELVFKKMYHILKPEGHLYLTVRLGEGSKWDKWDDINGDAERFIQLFNEEELTKILKDSAFAIKSSWIEDSYWGRPSKWLSIVALKL